ncbi:dienelactone hydrolase family protein [Kamptonema cortianum]|nr:dienelactone hydrolase family protein [Kamptonema cortianum]
MPRLRFYGGNDNRVNATIPASEKLMLQAEKKFEPVIYEGAGHGFMRSGDQPGAEAANAKGRQDAWKRWLTLLRDL